jgi:hypothetical protein
MSREHFIESHLEDKVNELIYEEDLSEEDAYIKARSIYDGEVNLMEEQAKKRHDEENLLKIQEKKDVEIRRKLRQSWYPSEIVLANVVEYLQAHYNSDSESTVVKEFCRELLTKINDDTLEVANAE